MFRDGHIAGHHLHLVLVLRLPVGVLHLLGEDEVELEQEHSPLPTLSDELLWVPDVEGVLEDDVAQDINTDITPVQQGEVESVVCLKSYNVTSQLLC